MYKNRLLEISLLALSLSAHLIVLSPWEGFCRFSFARPVTATNAVTVDLRDVSFPSSAEAPKVIQSTSPVRQVASTLPADPNDAAEPDIQPAEEPAEAEPASVEPADAEKPPAQSRPVNFVRAPESPHVQVQVQPPLRRSDEFLKMEFEKLSYSITMLGVPIGSARLEARNANGEVRITLQVSSNPAVSAMYPVNDFIETRHIGGNFIITKIRQQEGSFKSDRGFTIFLRDKRVFWIDLLRNRSDRESLPNSDVLDVFSALYYLRNRPLQVGKAETLHIYDSDTYSELPVEVVRREDVNLSGHRTGTLVVRPLFKTDGIFRRTGEMLIWLTDDDKKVPIKVETSIPLGVVTAQLVSAESSAGDAPQAAK